MRIRTLVAAGTLAAAAASGALAQEPVGQVTGTVFDKQHKGVSGLSVVAVAATGSLYGTSTDDGGRYALKGLEASTYTLILMLPSGSAARKEGIRVRPLFRSIVDFNLATEPPAAAPGAPAGPGQIPAGTFSLTASLAGPDRQPTPDASLALTPVGGAGALRSARTDPDGRCTLDDVPTGRYRITARAPGFITWSVGNLPLAGTGALKLSLTLVPFPLGFEGTIEDKLIPVDPIPPAGP